MNTGHVPRGADWGEIIDSLHGMLNIITVRTRYPGGHPAIVKAEETAAASFQKLLSGLPEVVVALVDGEFVVCERPMPDLRSRIPTLAEIMIRYEIECLVFQRGVSRAELALMGASLSSLVAPSDPARFREQTQAQLPHVLLRFAELRSHAAKDGDAAGSLYLVPEIHEMLAGAVRSILAGTALDLGTVRDIARRIVGRCEVKAFLLSPRAHAKGSEDHATHAANVASMSAAMALAGDAPVEDALETTAAALLHDLGKLLLPAAIRDIPEPALDTAGRTLYRDHPFLGARALLEAGCPALWVAAALEHHRGVDGGGYPAFKLGPIDARVRAISLANYFDCKRARVDGKGDDPEEVFKSAIALSGRYFDRPTLLLFLRALGMFPPGTTVELSDGQPALVARANANDPTRPEVRLLFGANAGKRADLKIMNAAEARFTLSIVRTLLPPLALSSEVAVSKSAAPVFEPPRVPIPTVPEATPPPSRPPASTPLGSGAPATSPLGSGAPATSPLGSGPPATSPSKPALPVVKPPEAVMSKPPAATTATTTKPPASATTRPPAEPMPGFRRPSAPPPLTREDPDPLVPRPTHAGLGAVRAGQAQSKPPEPLRPSARPSHKPIPREEPSAADGEPSSDRPRATDPRIVIPSRPATALVDKPVTIDTEDTLLARIGPLDTVLALVMKPASMSKLPLDHKAGFIVSLVDGRTDLDTVLDASGLPRMEALRLVADLVAKGVLGRAR